MSPQSLADADILAQILRQIPSWPKEGGDERCQYDDQGWLRQLDLSRLDLNTLPSETGVLAQMLEKLSQLSHLWTLNLSHNQLTYIPAEVGQLRELRRIYLSY